MSNSLASSVHVIWAKFHCEVKDGERLGTSWWLPCDCDFRARLRDRHAKISAHAAPTIAVLGSNSKKTSRRLPCLCIFRIMASWDRNVQWYRLGTSAWFRYYSDIIQMMQCVHSSDIWKHRSFLTFPRSWQDPEGKSGGATWGSSEKRWKTVNLNMLCQKCVLTGAPTASNKPTAWHISHCWQLTNSADLLLQSSHIHGIPL